MMDNDQVSTECKGRIFKIDHFGHIEAQNDKTKEFDPSIERSKPEQS